MAAEWECVGGFASGRWTKAHFLSGSRVVFHAACSVLASSENKVAFIR